MKIGYVCTNYKNSQYTRHAVESLLRNAGHEIQIVVVDNASGSEHVADLRRIADDFGNVTLICSEENLGYFSGLNLGIRYLREAVPEIDWLIVGNNDLQVPVDFLDRVQKKLFHLVGHAVISPDIVTIEGQHQNPHVISGIGKIRELFYDLYFSNYYLGMVVIKVAKMLPWLSERRDERQWGVPQHIYQGHGSCYLLGPRFFESFDELWAPTFMMYEEYFLSKQLGDAGMKVYYEPAIVVKHDCHGSLRDVPTRKRWEMARQAHKEYRKFVKIFG